MESANSCRCLWACRYPFFVEVDIALSKIFVRFEAMFVGRATEAPGLGLASCEEPAL